MNKISKIVVAATASLMSLIGSANADSSAFTGAYVAINGSALGIAATGTRTKTVGHADTRTQKGAVGMVSPAVGGEAGFSYPLSDMAFVTVGVQYQPFDTEVKGESVTNARNVKLTTNDIISVFIEPSFNVTENSAFFLKVAASESELDATGTNVNNKTYDLSGTTVAMGTKTISDNGMFLKTEAGITDYDSLNITGIKESDGHGTSTFTSSVKADVELAYGAVTVGYKF